MPELPKTVRCCGRVTRIAGGVDTFVEDDTGRVSYYGVHHCRSTAACPVCRRKKMAAWRETVNCYIEALRDRGGIECLVTFALPHRRGHDLKTLFQVLRGAVNRTFSGAGWTAIAKRYGYLGQAQVLETTWSPYAGYHPHVHALVFLSGHLGGGLPAFRLAVLARFSSALYREAERIGFDLPPIDVDRVVDVRRVGAAGEYLTKMGLAEELTSPDTKVGKDVHGVYHLTMGQLSRRLAWTRLRYGAEGPVKRERDRRRFESDKRVWLGYVGAMRGQQLFKLGRGLAARINALPLRPDVVPALSSVAGVPADEEAAPRQSLYHFSVAEWSTFRARGPLAQVELERRSEQERAPLDALRAFLRDVLDGRWRPATDALWGEDGDSPLLTEDEGDAETERHVRPLRPIPNAEPAAGDPAGEAPGFGVRDAALLHGGLSERGRARSRGHRRASPRGPQTALDLRLDRIASAYQKEQARDRHQYGGE